MKSKYHIEISNQVLDRFFSKEAIKQIIIANIKQDRPSYQFDHDYIHFDSSAFNAGFAYLAEQENILYQAIENESYPLAWTAIGRILHSWQDFYSHSNYVSLWLRDKDQPKPDEIDHDDQTILYSPYLKSGKNYGLVEFIALIPGISKLITPFMPADSHAKMNLDSPKSGTKFDYAFSAAKKRSANVVEKIINHIGDENFGQERIKAFLGK
jgi:hypothetical protein